MFNDISKRLENIHDDEPTLYVIDSIDALSDEREMKAEFDAASFGAMKAQRMSKFFRQINQMMSHKKFLLMLVSQTRANIGVMFGDKHTRSGGRSLDFYASQVLWLAHRRRIEKTVSGIKMVIGVDVTAQCKKNKIGMPFRKCEFQILFRYGIDDKAASIAFLKETKFKGLDALVKASDANEPGADEAIHKAAVGKWHEMETSLAPTARKYS